MYKLIHIITCITLIVIVSSQGIAQQQIPPESLNALQETFGMVRDNLWEINDEFWHHGEHNRCIAMMRLITQMDPHDAQAYDDGAWLMESDLRDEEAEAFLLLGLKNNPTAYNMYFSVGYFYYLHERFDEAAINIETAVSFGAPTITSHQLAHAYESAGYITDALNIWLLLEVLEPDSGVPPIQIDRILQGGPPSDIPNMISRSKEQRKAEQKANTNSSD